MFKTYIAKPKRNHGRQPLQQTNFQTEKLSSVTEALVTPSKIKKLPSSQLKAINVDNLSISNVNFECANYA